MIPLRDVPENRHEYETPRNGSVIVVFCPSSVRWPVRSIWAVAVDGCSEAVETLIVNYERLRRGDAGHSRKVWVISFRAKSALFSRGSAFRDSY